MWVVFLVSRAPIGIEARLDCDQRVEAVDFLGFCTTCVVHFTRSRFPERGIGCSRGAFAASATVLPPAREPVSILRLARACALRVPGEALFFFLSRIPPSLAALLQLVVFEPAD